MYVASIHIPYTYNPYNSCCTCIHNPSQNQSWDYSIELLQKLMWCVHASPCETWLNLELRRKLLGLALRISSGGTSFILCTAIPVCNGAGVSYGGDAVGVVDLVQAPADDGRPAGLVAVGGGRWGGAEGKHGAR